MPSTTSSSVSRLFASSTVMTPSFPTFCMAFASMRPTSWSPLAETVPTWAISSLVDTFLERFLMSSTTASTAASIPRFKSIGLRPAATALTPSRTMACANTVAVVVPSPAWSLVLVATSRIIWAPMFSNLSGSSISLATVKPSLVMRGAPNDLSSTTLRPLGPNVTLTALARMSTPRNMRSRASPWNFTSLAAILFSLCDLLCRGALLEDAHDVGFLHDDQLFAFELDLGARPFAEQHAIAGLDIQRLKLAVIAARTRTRSHYLAFLRLFFRRVGDQNATLRPLLRLDAPNQHAVVQRTEFHELPPRTHSADAGN